MKMLDKTLLFKQVEKKELEKNQASIFYSFSCGKFDLCCFATFSTVHVKLMIQLSTNRTGLTILEERSILINRLIPP